MLLRVISGELMKQLVNHRLHDSGSTGVVSPEISPGKIAGNLF